MPPGDQPPAADSANRRPLLAPDANPPTSRNRQIIAGSIAVVGGALILVAAAYLAFTWAFGSEWKTYLVGGGAMGAIIVLAIVLMLYAPSPTKAQPLTRLEDRGAGWAIGQATWIILNIIVLWHTVDEGNETSWDVWRALFVLMLISGIALAASNLMRWVKARRAGRDQGKAEP
jgi:MFS family permease